MTFRLSSFLSSGVLDKDSDQGSVNLRVYLLSKPQYINPNPSPGDAPEMLESIDQGNFNKLGSSFGSRPAPSKNFWGLAEGLC